MDNLRLKRLEEHLANLEKLKTDCRGAVALYAPILYDMCMETLELVKWALAREDSEVDENGSEVDNEVVWSEGENV